MSQTSEFNSVTCKLEKRARCAQTPGAEMLRMPPTRLEMKLDDGMLREHAKMLENKQNPKTTNTQSKINSKATETPEAKSNVKK